MSHPDPPWSGWISTTGDALLILEAARHGLIPRVTRRLVDAERKMIVSGSVFVFDEEESGIKRWTDGYNWSPSRILGNFLLYRETAGRAGRKRKNEKESDEPEQDFPATTSTQELSPEELLFEPKPGRSLVGSLGGGAAGGSTSAFHFKQNGLMKKTFSVTINGVPQHLISYYRVSDVTSGRLRAPSSLPELASLDISEEYLDKTHFRVPPKVEIGNDGRRRYRGEAEEEDVHGGLHPSMAAPARVSASRKGKSPAALLGEPVHVKTKRPPPAGGEDEQSGSKRKRSDSPGSPAAMPTPSHSPPYPNLMHAPPHPYYPFPPFVHPQPLPQAHAPGSTPSTIAAGTTTAANDDATRPSQTQSPPMGYPHYAQPPYPYPPPTEYYSHPYYAYIWPQQASAPPQQQQQQ